MNLSSKLLQSVCNRKEIAKKETNVLKKDVVYFWPGGKLKLGHENVRTNWTCEGSIGWNLGLRPKFVHLSLTYNFTYKELVSLIGEEHVKNHDKSWLKVGKGDDPTYRIIPSPFLPVQVVEKLWRKVKEATGLKEADLLPAYPDWIYEDKLGINFCVRQPGSKTFVDTFGKRRDIFYRAGKDLWKSPLFTKKAKVLVVDTPEGHDDGNMWVRSDKPFMYLVRGIAFSASGEALLLKGRIIGTPILPDGSKWPEGDYNILTSSHNVKWGSVPSGSIVSFDVQFVKNELQESASEDKKRKLTILTMLDGMMKIRPEYKDWLRTSFRRNAMNTVDLLQNFTKLRYEELSKAIEEDERSLIALDQALKVRMGFISESYKLSMIRKSQLAKLRSARIPGKWLSAIARNEVQRGEIWVSSEDNADLLLDEVTVIRYPVTGYQSFITLKVVYTDNLPKGLSVMNSYDAKYLALDGDDHILVTYPFSAFTGGEPVASERTVAEKLQLESLSFMELYLSGANAQSLIGYCFNAMATAMGFASTCKRKADAAGYERAKLLAGKLGMLLDILAQAIKKPYKYDLGCVAEASAFPVSPKQDAVASLCLSRDMDIAAKYLWGVNIPEIKPVAVMELGVLDIQDHPVLSSLVDSSLRKVKAAKNSHQEHKFLVTLSKDLLNWLVNEPDKEYAAMLYYSLAVRLWREDNAHPLLDFMDGSILLAGRMLCEQRYSPLFSEQ